MARPVLIIVSVKLVKNRLVEYTKFFHINKQKLKLKVYIRYKSATLNKKIITRKKKGIITTRRI